MPAQFRNFDLYSTYKVVVNEPKPYLRNNVYVAKYGKFKNYNGHQAIIRDSRDTKYYVVKGHPNYSRNKTVFTNNNNRPSRTKKTIVKVNQNSRTAKNNGRGNDNRGGNNSRTERNGNENCNGRH